MKTRKYGAIAVTAAALFMAIMLVTNCTNPMNLDNPNSDQGNNINRPSRPERVGLVRFMIREEAKGRSIVPTVPTFGSYTLVIRDNTNAQVGTALQIVPGAGGLATEQIQLPADTGYTAEVTAYIDGDATAPGTQVAAFGISAPFNVGAGLANLAGVIVRGLSDQTEDGTFEWDVTLPAAYDTAEMTLAALTVDGGNPSLIGSDFENPIDLDVQATGTGDLPSGFYRVTYTVTRASFQDRIITDILHVTNYATSTGTVVIPALIQRQDYLIDLIEAFGTGEDRTATVDRGQLLTDDATFVQPADGGNLDDATFEWGGWFLQAGGLGAEWDQDNDRIRRPMTLFAYWIDPASDHTVDIEVQPWDPENMQETPVTQDIYVDEKGVFYNAAGAVQTAINITITTTGYTNLQWTTSDLFDNTGAAVPLPTPTGNTLVLDISDPDSDMSWALSTPFEYNFELEADLDVNGVNIPHSGRGILNVIEQPVTP